MRNNAKKIILHIPHSSIKIPLKDGFIVNEEILENEILILTDWHTNDLFHAEDQHLVITDFSRIFCDIERL
jgi:N-formylglutamate deformylase